MTVICGSVQSIELQSRPAIHGIAVEGTARSSARSSFTNRKQISAFEQWRSAGTKSRAGTHHPREFSIIALLVIAGIVGLFIGLAPHAPAAAGATEHVRRRGLLVETVALILGFAVVLAPSASASKPVRIPAPIGNSNTFPAGTICPFTLKRSLSGATRPFTCFDDGRFHATGRHIDQYTNVDAVTSTTIDLQGR